MHAFAQIITVCMYFCAALPSTVSNGRYRNPIQTNVIQRTIHKTPLSNVPFEIKTLKRVFLSNRSITCNDGSPAGFYLRKSHTSKKWIIFLEGGWYCYDYQSCRNRWLKQRELMTSSNWPETRNVDGILSPEVFQNRFWWEANHVYVPYCTSDVWSGTKNHIPGEMFSFMGSLVVKQVVQDLLPLGLENGTDLLLTGSSAGGTGVMLNLDPVSELLNEDLGLKNILVKGVTDSGWFLDRTPYAPTLKPAVVSIKKGMTLWQGKVPRRCREAHISEPWRCYFGYRLYPSLKRELFVFQWMFDEAQMDADNVGPPVSKQQWDYIHKMGDALRQSFKNVSAVFAPSCISHSVLTRSDWESVKIDDVSIAEAIHCWEKRINRRLKNNHVRKGKKAQAEHPVPSHDTGMKHRTMSEDPQAINKKRKKKKQRKNKGCEKNNFREVNRNCRNQENSPVTTNDPKSLGFVLGRRNKNKINKGRRCAGRRLERCSWPQCNHSCPRLRNPLTGEDMDFLDLLQSFGLDMERVADALGIDIQTLVNMDHSDLLNLLTQQAN